MDNLAFHNPVLLKEVLQHMNCCDQQTYIDATFGAGGYSRAMLEAANCNVIAFDRDANVLKFANNLQQKFGERFRFFNNKFSQIDEVLKQNQIDGIDGVVYDLGVSSMQLDDKSRGFSFDSDARLDMRMDQENPLSAFEVVNEFDQNQLTQIIKDFGEERKAKLIAAKIIQQRSKQEIVSCKELADIVRSFYKGYHKIDPATKTFQAIRIFVNRELEEIKDSLQQSLSFVHSGGKIVVVSFHSLEDGLVKAFFKKESGDDVSYSRYQPIAIDDCQKKNLKILTKSAVKPSDEEIRNNSRSRSSRLRAAIKL